jgi:predicted Holliday junction resolvase-like endonuclease
MEINVHRIEQWRMFKLTCQRLVNLFTFTRCYVRLETFKESVAVIIGAAVSTAIPLMPNIRYGGDSVRLAAAEGPLPIFEPTPTFLFRRV